MQPFSLCPEKKYLITKCTHRERGNKKNCRPHFASEYFNRKKEWLAGKRADSNNKKVKHNPRNIQITLTRYNKTRRQNADAIRANSIGLAAFSVAVPATRNSNNSSPTRPSRTEKQHHHHHYQFHCCCYCGSRECREVNCEIAMKTMAKWQLFTFTGQNTHTQTDWYSAH